MEHIKGPDFPTAGIIMGLASAGLLGAVSALFAV